MRRSLAIHALRLAGLAVLVVAVYAVFVLLIGHVPTADQWNLIVLSMLAAAVVALAYQPLRRRIDSATNRRGGGHEQSADAVLRSFGSRIAMPVSLDELLLQLAESLRQALWLDCAEVWTGASGVLERAASDPDVGRGSLILTPAERSIVARAELPSHAWLEVWLPQVLAGHDGAGIRVAPVTHSGELLGLLVLRGSRVLSRADEQSLSALARQVGLTLNNVRLGSALEASLDELRAQAEELRASRARVVAAADAERRRIERDLHDGAQQHLVGLGVQLQLARQLVASDSAAASALLEELSREVHVALENFRDLAHGVYPPLLVARGVAEGLREAALRAPIRTHVEAQGLRRYPPEVEATVYFCCLEAMQNAGKHAASATRVVVRVWEDGAGLRFEVADDGPGLGAEPVTYGAGLTNMSDRLGALGGRLSIVSSPGGDTRVAGAIPL